MNNLDKILQSSIKEYFTHGPRSNKKLIPIHNFIKESIEKKLDCDNKITCHSLPESEISVNGKYYKKKVDICVKNKNSIYGCISVKFIMSNYSQNKNNYFENLIGELYNLKKNGLIQWFILITFDDIPYYNIKNEIKKYEQITHQSSEYYNNLVRDNLLDHLTIITLSNGKSLIHPNNLQKKNDLKEDQFKIIKEYPDPFYTSLTKFCLNINQIINE